MKTIIRGSWCDLEFEEIVEEIGKSIGRGYHYLFFRPEKAKNRKNVQYTADQIREFIRGQVQKRDPEEPEQVCVFLQADTMSHIVQNMLLKTLEESPYHVLLLVENVDSLLSTIRSRCQTEYIVIKDRQRKNGVPELLDLSSAEKVVALAKQERDEVIRVLELEMQATPSAEYSRILALQEAVHKIKANCKVEAVLFEYVNNAL
ncbi:MAG: hypothetical protein ACOCXT_03590 [Candidatus Dojkabacteria bacterium]